MLVHLRSHAKACMALAHTKPVIRKKMNSLGSFDPVQPTAQIVLFRAEKTSLKDIRDGSMLSTFNRSPAVFNVGQSSPKKGSALASPLKNLPQKLELPGIRSVVRAPSLSKGTWSDYSNKPQIQVSSAKKPKVISIDRGQQDAKTPLRKDRQMTEVLENIVRSSQKVDRKGKIEQSPKHNFTIFDEKPIFKTEFDFKFSAANNSSIRIVSKQEAGERSLNLSALKTASFPQPSQTSIDNFDRLDHPQPAPKTPIIKISGLLEASDKFKPSISRFKSLEQEASYLSRISKVSPQKKRKPQKKIQVNLETVLEQQNGMMLSSTAEC